MSPTRAVHLHEDDIMLLSNGMLSITVASVNVDRFTILTINGLNLPSTNPTGVFVSVRAPGNNNPQYTDSFVVTVNEVEQSALILKIWRVDSQQNPAAPIRLDILVIP